MRVLRSVGRPWRLAAVSLAAGAVLATTAGAAHAIPARAAAIGAANAAATTLNYTGPTAVDAEQTFNMRAQLKSGTRSVGGKTVTFTFAGVTTSAVTNSNGLAVVSTRAPSVAGPYTIEIAFAGDETYDPASIAPALEVRKLVPVVNYLGTTSAAPAGTILLKANLKRGVRSVVGRTLTFTLDGATYSAVTNGAGAVQLEVTAPAAEGTFPVDISFAGDDTYEAASTTASLTLARLATTLTYTGVTTVAPNTRFPLYASLKSGARSVAGKTVTFVFNGETGTAVTNNNGLATFRVRAPITPGSYDVAISFDGDVSYFPSTAAGTIAVG
jgi:hypothetical protein